MLDMPELPLQLLRRRVPRMPQIGIGVGIGSLESESNPGALDIAQIYGVLSRNSALMKGFELKGKL